LLKSCLLMIGTYTPFTTCQAAMFAPSVLIHSEDSQRRQDVRYWAMVWGMEPWHNGYVWF
jgi:hypothetical protein